MSDKIDLASVAALPNLPHFFRPAEGDPLPDDLVGAMIVRFGAVAEPEAVHGGGLVIDYIKPDEDTTRRLVLAFTDEAGWAAFQGTMYGRPNRV